MISQAGRVNYPIAAVFGDAQRYQDTKLIWPVVGPHGFDPSINPIKEGVSKPLFGPPLIDFSVTIIKCTIQCCQVSQKFLQKRLRPSIETVTSSTKAVPVASNVPFRVVTTSNTPTSSSTSMATISNVAIYTQVCELRVGLVHSFHSHGVNIVFVDNSSSSDRRSLRALVLVNFSKSLLVSVEFLSLKLKNSTVRGQEARRDHES